MDTKIIAYYLPQYHEIAENNMWWGEGFTEWTNVKKAVPFLNGQVQPRVPLDNNYYNLLDKNTVEWQTKLANEYGVYGFCYFHYYFGNGKYLLEKPAENLLKWKDIDQKFCFFWANSSWGRTWSANEYNATTWSSDGEVQKGQTGLLVEQKYGGEQDWKTHIDYLIPFFKDERYIKIDNKPFFAIYEANSIPNLDEMITYWENELKKHGIEGVYVASVNAPVPNSRKISAILQYSYGTYSKTLRYVANQTVRKSIALINKQFNTRIWDYEKIWKMITERLPEGSIHSIPGGTVQYDETPRRGDKALVFTNSNPDIFEKYLKIQLMRAKNVYHSEYLFLDAWNEWGEGNYLEPDNVWGYKYLEALKRAVDQT